MATWSPGTNREFMFSNIVALFLRLSQLVTIRRTLVTYSLYIMSTEVMRASFHSLEEIN